QAEADAGERFSEELEQPGVDTVDSGQLHAVGARVRRRAREEQVRDVRVLALVPIEGYAEEAQPDQASGDDHEGDAGPRSHGVQSASRAVMSPTSLSFRGSSHSTVDSTTRIGP